MNTSQPDAPINATEDVQQQDMRPGLTRRTLLALGGVGAIMGLTGVGCSSIATRAIRLSPLDRPSDRVQRQTAVLTTGASSPREQALAIYRFVRDEIHFGFTPRFDAATPDETLAWARGHCNPQATLFGSMLYAAGIEARQRFVTITNEVLYGLFPERAAPPERITHSFIELQLGDRWIALDGYILDPAFFYGARARLQAAGRELGFGAHARGAIEWDGENDCMSQFADPSMVLPGDDHGGFIDPGAFYSESAYVQKLGPVASYLYKRLSVPPTNDRVTAIRREGRALLAANALAG